MAELIGRKRGRVLALYKITTVFTNGLHPKQISKHYDNARSSRKMY